MGVFGIAAGVAAFPTISRMVGEGRHDEAYQTLSGAVRTMSAAMAACCSIVLNGELSIACMPIVAAVTRTVLRLESP